MSDTFELPDPVPGVGPLGVRVVGNDGPVVVLVHGLGRVAACWANVATHTRDRLRLVLPDNPGLGRSSHVRVPRTISEHAALHLETLEALHLPPPYHCAGLSLGGMVAPELAVALGDRAASVTLFSASARESGFWRLSGRSMCRMAARVIRHLSLDHRVNMPELVRPELLAADPELPHRLDALQRSEGFSSRNGTRQLLAAMRWKIRPILDRLPKRRLVVVGSNDRLVPAYNSHRLARLLNCPIQVLEGYGHDLGHDAPEEVARVLIEVCDA
ncbi:MAG: alpha/beta hydrolase [Planctomycetes bacterium]|nr:alpha/beta hydrolase [Planctomycetota bacterium]